jgi:hypothetical protein
MCKLTSDNTWKLEGVEGEVVELHRKFGFILWQEEKIFFHHSGVIDNGEKLERHCRVRFSLGPDDWQKGKLKAFEIRVVEPRCVEREWNEFLKGKANDIATGVLPWCRASSRERSSEAVTNEKWAKGPGDKKGFALTRTRRCLSLSQLPISASLPRPRLVVPPTTQRFIDIDNQVSPQNNYFTDSDDVISPPSEDMTIRIEDVINSFHGALRVVGSPLTASEIVALRRWSNEHGRRLLPPPPPMLPAALQYVAAAA